MLLFGITKYFSENIIIRIRFLFNRGKNDNKSRKFPCCEVSLHTKPVPLHTNKRNIVAMAQTDFIADKLNKEQQQAFDLVANTNVSLFITGKAGTGKTTFIRRILKEIDKNFLVLAPTGIAAINAGGQTIHSFFGFPLSVIGPRTVMRFSEEKRDLVKMIDTIIVDEASMVRSDMVDGMDRCLRQVMRCNLPFGGKQIVFVGDLFQLPPVVGKNEADMEMLQYFYGAGVPYFYKALVMKRMNLPNIEFKKVYRQNDAAFLDILNRMRTGEVNEADLVLLNSHVCKEKGKDDYSITLAPYVKIAENINEKRLAEIDREEFCYEGMVEGDIKDFIVPLRLKLKVGAQVIFCRNDVQHRYVNGTIAKVVELEKSVVKVKCEDGAEINVEPVTWESEERLYNPETHHVEAKVVGSFTQYPLKLAWAISIHKAQGMTFDRMHLDLSRGTFAAGQAYVAISRMRSLEGLTLSYPICRHHVIISPDVKVYANSFNDTKTIKDELAMGKAFYKHLAAKDYDKAALACLKQVKAKTIKKDYRNAALLAKKMFDVMQDDEKLMGKTVNMPLLKECSMTSYFLNAVFCLYGNRYEEAMGYADLVLSRRACPEAMFIKGRAMYVMGKYKEAEEMVSMMTSATLKSEEERVIDKKLLLLKEKVNDKVGN